jgi:hypothetical protein
MAFSKALLVHTDVRNDIFASACKAASNSLFLYALQLIP